MVRVRFRGGRPALDDESGQTGVPSGTATMAAIPQRTSALFPRLTRLKRRIEARHSVYSCVSVMAGLLLLSTVIIDLVFSADAGVSHTLQIVMISLCAAFTAVPLVMGRRYPPGFGLIPVGLVGVASVYFIGFADVDQSVVSSLQELPMVALYLGWFYRAKHSRPLMLLFSLVLIAAILRSPSFGPDGHFTVPTGFAAIAIMCFCFEAGSFLQRELLRHASHDHLTGVLNRRGFGRRFAIEHERSRRFGSKLYVAVLDFDEFKRVNDELGHGAGDELLRSSARAWALRLSGADVIGRLGGDEFVLLLPNRSRRDAAELLAVLQHASTHAWSWGLSDVQSEDTLEAALSRADQELYERKAGTYR